MISNSGSDERGKYNQGKSGDQTGKEWRIIPWYCRPWDLVLRYEGEAEGEVRQLIADLAEEAAQNDCIGYDQYQRLSFWYALQNANYRPANIKVDCESDCSAGALAICKATGYLLNIDPLKKIEISGYSGNIEQLLNRSGFKSLRDSKYLKSDEYLLPGDVLVYVGHHVAINLHQGKKLEVEVKKPYKLGWNRDSCGWWYADGPFSYLKDTWKVINNHWYYFNNLGYILKGLNSVNGSLYYFTESGDLEGALQHTNSKGELVEWFID